MCLYFFHDYVAHNRIYTSGATHYEAHNRIHTSGATHYAAHNRIHTSGATQPHKYEWRHTFTPKTIILFYVLFNGAVNCCNYTAMVTD